MNKHIIKNNRGDNAELPSLNFGATVKENKPIEII